MSISKTIYLMINIVVVVALNTTIFVVQSAHQFDPNAFQRCVIAHSPPQTPPPPSSFYSPATNKTSFYALLNSNAHNLRLLVPSVAKPLLIFTPTAEPHVKSAVVCARLHLINFRVRSGGHDYEGLSYASFTGNPFIVVDMSRLRYIHVDATSRTAWAQAGATVGELYYRISRASPTLAFPAGLCTTIGLGGHLSGGAYGMLMRKHGLGDDNVPDARIVTASGEIQDRIGMGEDLFWAIRGGTGGSFGIVLAWKLQLVTVPEKVTVFTVPRGTEIVHRWQRVAPKLPEEFFIRVIVQPGRDDGDVLALYQGALLGDRDSTYKALRKSFPELGLRKKDCTEMSWIESVMIIAGFPSDLTPEYLLQVKPAFINSFKAKSDYITEAIEEEGLKGMWERVKGNDGALVIFTPFGGKVSEIEEESIPYPHRNAIAMIQYVGQWGVDQGAKQDQEDWVRGMYDYMTKHVTSHPREAYGNYRDLDIGMDESGSNCSWPKLWGPKYFKNNYMRLLKVKGQVDPYNAFTHELSIPTGKSVDSCTQLY